MAASVVGRVNRIAVSDDGGTIYSDLGCLQDASLSAEKDQIDSTCKNDGQYRQFLDGHLAATIDFTLAYDETDPGQTKAAASFYGGADVDIRFRMTTGAGLEEIVDVKASVSSWTLDAPLEGLATVSGTFQLKGDFSPSAQP